MQTQGYSRFKTRVGVADTSANTSGKVEILADGKQVFTRRVSLTTSYPVDLNIKGVQRLEVKQLPSDGGGMIYAIGDPMLIP